MKSSSPREGRGRPLSAAAHVAEAEPDLGEGLRKWRGEGIPAPTEPSTDVLPELLRPGRRPVKHPSRRTPAAGLPPLPGRLPQPPAGRPLPSAQREADPGESGVLRVLICDELPVVRDGLRALLATEPGIQVIGTVDSGGQALASIRAHRPDVAITGLALGGMRALELIRRLSQGACGVGAPVPKVIVFVMNDDADLMASLLRADVDGLLVVNDTSKAELAAAIRAAARGQIMVSPSVTRHLVDWFREFGGEPTDEMMGVRALLTPRERDVLGLIAEGMSPEAVAGELVISVATVRTHVYRARVKLEARDRAQLVAMAYRVGLVRRR